MKRLLIGMVVAGCSAVGIPAFANGGFGPRVEPVRVEVRYDARDLNRCDDLRNQIAIQERQAEEARRCGRPDLALERCISEERLELGRLTTVVREDHVHFAPVRHDFNRHDHDKGHFVRDGRR